MIRSKKRIRLCVILLVANLAVIWGNSLLPGSESGAMSGGVMEFIRNLLGIPESQADLLHKLVRKLAHFTEFSCLGALLCWRCGMEGERHKVAFPALLGMAAAVVDESLQLITPDRGPSLTDVWIDTSGVLTGLMMVLLGHYLLTERKNKIINNIGEQ